MGYALGVDIGGTKIAVATIDNDGKLYKRTEVPSDPLSKEKMFDQVIKGIEMALTASQLTIKEIQGIGVGVPGKVDRENGIAIFQNNLPWANFPIAQRLREKFLIDKVVVDNDVYIATFAEWQAANVGEKDTFVYLTVSTGISCAIIHEGSFLSGNGFAGELGLLPVTAKATSLGIDRLEKAAAGPAMEAYTRELFNNQSLTTKDFFRKYEEGNPQAISLMNDVANSLAHGIYSIITLLDPHKIVLGGGVINHNPFLLDLIKELLKKDYLITEQQHVLANMSVSQLKGDSGVIGAGLKGIQS